MPLRKFEWKFDEGIYKTAAELKIPYTRLYNKCAELGLTDGIKNEADLHRVALALVRGGGLPVEGLVKIFGPSLTLSQLAKMEAEFVAPSVV